MNSESNQSVIDFKELFNLSLEIEGLLSLVVAREDMCPDEVYSLLRDKVAKMHSDVNLMTASHLGENIEISANVDTNESAAAREKAELDRYLASVPAIPGLSDENVDEFMTEAKIEETGKAADNHGPSQITDDKDIAETVDFELKEEAVADAAHETIMPDTLSHTVVNHSGLSASVASECNRGDIRKMFTLNDKFRFRRELFGNSEIEFSDALNTVGAMRSMSEAEDYFYNDLGWNSEIDEVKEFMELLRQYFS